MITEARLLDSDIQQYDHPGTVLPWRDGVNGKSRITALWGKNGAFIYKDHTGYYGLGKNQVRVDLKTIAEANIFVNT